MSQLNQLPMFFLGANSPEGFISKFSSSYFADTGWRTYIIKGGPGTGKSTLLKNIATHFLNWGARIHLCPCSSDPHSLDAVILCDLKIVLLDGTSPHVVEPQFPGVCEEIINLGENWDAKKLDDNRDKIIELTKQNKECHRRVSRYITAAGKIIEDSFYAENSCLNANKAKLYAQKLAKKYIKKATTSPQLFTRYLSGITPVGHIFYKKTLNKLCDTQIVFADECGSASAVILNELQTLALNSGHEVISCPCPLSPKKIEHIILPSQRLSFSTSNRYHPIASSERIIHARRFLDLQKYHSLRDRVNYNRQKARDLLDLAVDALNDAKLTHDSLESYYISAMDFEKLESVQLDLIKKIEDSIK